MSAEYFISRIKNQVSLILVFSLRGKLYHASRQADKALINLDLEALFFCIFKPIYNHL